MGINTETDLTITDLITESALRKMQDSLAVSTGMAVCILDGSGRPVTDATPKKGICKNCICSSLSECIEKSEECKGLFPSCPEDELPAFKLCKAGLMLMSSDIDADGKNIGKVLCGQVFIAEKGELVFKDSDDEIIRAINNTTKIDRKTLKNAALSLKAMTASLSAISQRAYLLDKTVQEAAAASRVKSDFLANMSHEIRTPMNAVLGMVDLALREDMPSAAREYVTQIKVAGKNLLAIINDILDFSKIESGEMEMNEDNYQIYSVLNDAANIVTIRLGEKEIEFTMDIAADIPRVLCGDSAHLHQILINILSNAVKFTNKGNINLSVSCESWENDQVMLLFKISDTGIGIKEEDKSKLFESFQQVNASRSRNNEGTGLGLAITNQMLMLMDGNISLESEFKKGSTFYIRLPQKVVEKMPSVPVADKKKICYILIENEYSQAQIIADLERIGIECRVIDECGCIENDKPDYLIIDKNDLTNELVCFYEKNPAMHCIAVADYSSRSTAMLPNVKTISKPLYALMLYNAMELCDIQLFTDITEPDEIKFVAPTANILIVDDNTVNLTVAKGILQPLKMNIDLAENAGEAIEHLMEKEYDIIFMDHMMPEVDGIEATHMIRRIMPEYDNMPIIALTANAVSGAREMFLAEGLSDFVAKPINFKIISSVIYKWLPKDKIVPVTEDDEAFIKTSDNEDEFSIPGLDTAGAIAGLGSRDLYMTVLNEYFKSITPKAETIKKHYESGDIHNYTIEVHSLKSTSRQIGAMELGELAYSLEMAGKSGDMDLINAKTAEVLEMYTAMKDILRPYVTVEENVPLKEASKDAVLAVFDALSEALASFDAIEIDELIGKLAEFDLKSDKQKEYLEQMKSASEMMDIDNIESIMNEWRNEL